MKLKDMRILFVHSGADLYGASRSLLRLSARLVSDGVEVMVLLPYEGPLVAALQEKNVKIIVQKNLPVIERQQVSSVKGILRFLFNFFSSMIDLWKVARKFRPTVIHTMTAVILSPGWVARLMKVPHIWHVRESFGEFGGLWRFYQKYMLLLSTRIICVSTSIAEQFNSYKDSEKIKVLHNGFPMSEFFTVQEEDVVSFRQKYGAPVVKYLVGVVGRIKYQRKGQEVFVQAASLLRDKFPDARFLCIGSPFPGNESHLKKLLGLINSLGLEQYVIYTGDVENITAAISALDILVLSSVQPEPFAGVVVEAMALACPVVATAIGGSLEQVVNGVTGFLVQPGDPRSMAAAIERLLASAEQRQTFGKNGRERFMVEFEFEPFYQKMLAIYQEAHDSQFKKA